MLKLKLFSKKGTLSSKCTSTKFHVKNDKSNAGTSYTYVINTALCLASKIWSHYGLNPFNPILHGGGALCAHTCR